MSQNLDFGRLGESLACDYLKKNGFIILKRNFYCKYGEIDIIATKNKVLHFIEIKTRHGLDFGDPIFAINAFKQEKIKKTALIFLSELEEDNFVGYIFDALTIVFTLDKYNIEFFENIF